MTSPIAFQGEPGAFGEEAARRLWPDGAWLVPMRTFSEVAHAVATGDVAGGVLPVENVIAGPVDGALAALAEVPGIRVAGDTWVPVVQCLLGLPEATLGGLRSVASHPVALAQCRSFLRAHPWLAVWQHWDTAAAAREVADARDPTRAAIASAAAAERYGLLVLATGIADRADNATRFVAIVKR